jgi:hypothetical protein
MRKGGGSMFKAKLITLTLTLSASPLAFVIAKLALGTKLGGGSSGGPYMS